MNNKETLSKKLRADRVTTKKEKKENENKNKTEKKSLKNRQKHVCRGNRSLYLRGLFSFRRPFGINISSLNAEWVRP